MINKDKILEATLWYYDEMESAIRHTHEIGQAYLDTLVKYGMSEEEALELYAEASVILGKNYFQNAESIESTKKLLDMIKD